jgi:hypothetical protein
MPEVKYRDGKSESQRIAERLRPSNSPAAVHTYAEHGTGPTRTISTVHRAGHQALHHESRSVTDLPVIPIGGGTILGQKGSHNA